MEDTIEVAPENLSSRLPYEILSKIFVHCLPPHPLTELQPNTKIAPMLLCHICPSWRGIALSCAPLWSHLYFQLPILWDPQHGHPVVWDLKALIGDMECLRWWRKNQGSIPPFIHFDARRKIRERRLDVNYQECRLDSDSEDFMLDYISSAQYLDVHPFYQYLTTCRQAAHDRPNPMCPNLHTLITVYSSHFTRRYSSLAESGEVYTANAILVNSLPFVPLQIPPTLRRLSLFNDEYELEWINNLGNWSMLTHLSLNLACTIRDWFSVMGAIPNLQWCHIYVLLVDEDITNYIQPTKIILPRLSTLFLFCGSAYSELLHFPMSALFHNLEFPALQDLHLSGENMWWDSRAVVEIRTSLRCAPALSKLTLKWDFLLFGDDSELLPISTPGEDIAPLSSYAPLLTHLQLQLVCPITISDAVSQGERFVREIFHSKLWLFFENLENIIQKVTIVIEQSNNSERLKDILTSGIMKGANKPANVTFEVTSRPGHCLGHQILLDEMLKTWGTKLMM